MTDTFGERVIAFHQRLHFTTPLPQGIRVMNPLRENQQVLPLMQAFYTRFYHDNRIRRLILGINPGRFGGGITGIPFTDTKRLTAACGIPYAQQPSHEPSSVFIYEMIEAFGGVEAFYAGFYINSVCPLGFTRSTPGNKEINYNYYDDAGILTATEPFIEQTLPEQCSLGVFTDTVFCFGTGKNEKYLKRLNERLQLFNRIVPLEHPRFIMQYRSKQKTHYIDKYLAAFLTVMA